MYSVFIDGQEGTTGLQIHDRLKARNDIQILEIPHEKRKDIEAKSEYINSADAVILCLPDTASKESASLVKNPKTKVIDASTAFRTADDWVYGLPELNKSQRQLIKSAKKISNPGCHATGFVVLMNPLVTSGIVPRGFNATCYSITGYSGGGKKLIAEYQNAPSEGIDLNQPRYYGLSLKHKHLPEMRKHAGLETPPIFLPILGNFYKGMVVSVPLHVSLLSRKVSAKDVHDIYAQHFVNERFIRLMPFQSEDTLENGRLSPIACNDTNFLDIYVFGDDRQIVTMARFDNLGKGASGAAVQNLNIALGAEESTGLL
ncbi:MAG: N-acetyl-gamma-glutamyl-phosphate reductase [Fibrobacter sp.]|nr:N-acetyl-gamma-glutamyl-phosphate reductase [Fibrobacter sp.]